MGDCTSASKHLDSASRRREGTEEEAQLERQRGGVREHILEEMRSKLRCEGQVGTGPGKGKVGASGRGTSIRKGLG